MGLLRCPFCGGKAALALFDEYPVCVYAFCTLCKIRTDTEVEGKDKDTDYIVNIVNEKWNRREGQDGVDSMGT